LHLEDDFLASNSKGTQLFRAPETLQLQANLEPYDVAAEYLGGLSAALSKLPPQPIWISPQVKYGNDPRLISRFSVIDSERKSAGQHPMTSNLNRMYPMEQGEALDIGKQ
jgi:hypothetical protein